MRTPIFNGLVLLAIILCGSSCRKNFEYAPSAGNLSFSKDTVYLDTIFNTIGSSTYGLKVYNDTRDDVVISSVRLANGPESFYRLNVDGVAGKTFKDVPIKAQDSIFIFIEATANIGQSTENKLLYTDVLTFDAGIDEQTVQLVTLVKDAVFLYPKTNADGTKETILLSVDAEGNEIRVAGFELADDQLHFTNEKPYVVYGYAAVTESKELIVDAGARVHFHKDSGLLVQQEGSVKINGTLSQDQDVMEGEVIFEGDRLEPSFSEIAGQWGIFWIASGSVNNTINYLTVKNGSVGLLAEGDNELQSPTLQIKNSRFFNNSNYNLWAKNAFITAENTVFGGAGLSSVYINLGGKHIFTHCTIGNFWNKGFRMKSALEIDDFIRVSETITLQKKLTLADFRNCIIDGNSQLELRLRTTDISNFNYNFTNSSIKFKDLSNQFSGNPLYDFDGQTRYVSVLLNGDSDFFFSSRNDFRIGLESDALSNASLSFAQEVPLDILGIDRTIDPAVGAYQATKKE